MFIASKTAFNVYSKFNTLKISGNCSTLPTKLHAYYDQTEQKLSRFGRLMNSDDIIEKVKTIGCFYRWKKPQKSLECRVDFIRIYNLMIGY